MLYREAGQFKSTYAEDQRIFPILQDRIAFWLFMLVAFVLVPIVGDQYWLSALITPFLIFAVARLELTGLAIEHPYTRSMCFSPKRPSGLTSRKSSATT